MADPVQPAPDKSNLEHAFGWLGRQIGHVTRAIRTPVGQRVVYRKQQTDELPMPGQPGVTLRRTTTDEVIVHPRGSTPRR